MDIAVKERLIGAAVLVVIVVLVVPALLTGPRPPAATGETPSGDTRVVEIDLAGTGVRRDTRPAIEAVEAAPGVPQDPAATSPPPSDPPPAAPPVTAPAASLPPAESAPKPAPQAPAERQAGWAVQVAALSKQEAAEQMVADLRGRGYPAYALEHRSGGKVLYRVRVGPESERERAERLAGRLRDEGLKPTVVSQP